MQADPKPLPDDVDTLKAIVAASRARAAANQALFRVTPRGWADPSLLVMIVFEKYDQHQPLNRQAERYAREGVSLPVHLGRPGGCLHHGADAAV